VIAVTSLNCASGEAADPKLGRRNDARTPRNF